MWHCKTDIFLLLGMKVSSRKSRPVFKVRPLVNNSSCIRSLQTLSMLLCSVWVIVLTCPYNGFKIQQRKSVSILIMIPKNNPHARQHPITEQFGFLNVFGFLLLLLRTNWWFRLLFLL